MSKRTTNLSADEAWLPYEPSDRQPFDRRRAAHLFRRAGFAASSSELDAAVKLGPTHTVKKMLNAGEENEAFDAEMQKVAATMLAAGNPQLLAPWWLYRMRHTPAPLLEKTTLFWHGHFATSAAKVRDPKLMFQQNELLRQHALGKFGDLLPGIARDPAMLLYLDSATNRKIHPNENFAREVMELFCLGVGRYSEKDIQELARCFTGGEVQYGTFRFNPYQHDAGKKTVLGTAGQFDAEDGLQIILKQDATAEFLCTKLVRFFVMDDDVPAELIAPLAKRYRESGLAAAPVLETILTSRLFYSDAAIAGKIRSPVDLGVGLLRALEATANMQQLATDLGELGQLLFFPPNVKGWNGGLAWINSSTLLARNNLVRSIVESPGTRYGGVAIDDYLDHYDLKTSAAVVEWLSELLLATPLPQRVHEQLAAELDRAKDRAAGLRQLLHLIGSQPEFQLA